MPRVLNVPFQPKYKDEEDKANGLTSPPNDLGLMVWPGFELTTSRSVDRRSSNWANRVAVKSDWAYDRKKSASKQAINSSADQNHLALIIVN